VAIPDLFWACPLCRELSGLSRDRRNARCSACSATFRRSRGATIVARSPDGREVARQPADWLAQLPPLDADGPLVRPRPPGSAFRAHVSVRSAHGNRPVRWRGELIGWTERFSPPQVGELTLDAERVGLAGSWSWPLEQVTVVQPTSAALQIRERGGTLVLLRFLDSALPLWEARFHTALRARYAALGIGKICEFQPRILTE
jgi:hypothetical protein